MNSSRFAYLLVDGLCFIFPFILSFLRPFRFVEHGKHFLLAATITSIPFLIWDSIFTSLSVWWFSEKYTLPFRIFSLPLEEILFFFAIPYACVFSYHVIKKFIPKLISDKMMQITMIVLIACTASVAFLNTGKYYTFWTFFFLSIFILYLLLRKKFTLMYYCVIMFVFVFPMMILSNGILTGGFIVQSPIVNYNPLHHIGLRIISIPVEDFFYGFLLLGLNTFFFEKFSKKFQNS